MSLIEVERSIKIYKYRTVEDALKAAHASHFATTVKVVSAPQWQLEVVGAPFSDEYIEDMHRQSTLLSLEAKGAGPMRTPNVYFMYDNFLDPYIFVEKYPGITFMGFALLGGWSWHVNQKGKPNIRLGFNNPQYIPGNIPFSDLRDKNRKPPKALARAGTWGYVFRTTPEIDIQIEGDRDTSLIQGISTAKYCDPKDGKYRNCKVRFHFDPRNTIDINRRVFNHEEMKKWAAGLNRMIDFHVAKEHLDYIWDQLYGIAPNTEALARIKRGTNEALELRLPGFFSSPRDSPVRRPVPATRAKKRPFNPESGASLFHQQKRSRLINNHPRNGYPMHSDGPGPAILCNHPSVRASATGLHQAGRSQLEVGATYRNVMGPVRMTQPAKHVSQSSSSSSSSFNDLTSDFEKGSSMGTSPPPFRVSK
ncbi:hypothetical protein B7463_g7813, partial [Scytalidium lignicola]